MKNKIDTETRMSRIPQKYALKTKIEKRADRAFSVLTYSILITLCANIIGSKAECSKRFEGVNQELFVNNAFNIPVTLPISNGTVNLNIKKCFNREQLNQILKGISELDDVAKGIDFTVSFSDRDMNKSINIKSYTDIRDQSIVDDSYGFANIRANAFSGKITYPVNLYLNTKDIDSNSKNCSSIIKHELMHCLGFTDLIDDEYMDYLMYYTDCGNKDLSFNEKVALNTVYSPKNTGYAKIKKPVKVNYQKIKDTYFNQVSASENEFIC